MPEKHPNTERWGGPGASHEDASKPQPPKIDPRAPGEPTNTPLATSPEAAVSVTDTTPMT